MPGNTVKINNSFEYYVGDSRMRELFEFLDDIGHREGLMVGDTWPDFKTTDEANIKNET